MTLLLSSLVLVLLGVLTQGALARKRIPSWAIWLLTLPFCIPWGLFVAYYMHVLDRAWYYEWRSWHITDYAPSLAGFAVGVLLSHTYDKRGRPNPYGEKPPRPWVIVGLGTLVSASMLVVAFARPILRPLPSTDEQARWKDGVCLQTTSATCGPCAAATVMQAIGYPTTEIALAHDAHTDAGGTLAWLLVRALRDRGIEARFVTPSSLARVRLPAIIGVRLPNGVGHFLAYLERRGELHVIGEPLRGSLLLSGEAFRQRYQFDHFAIEVGMPNR